MSEFAQKIRDELMLKAGNTPEEREEIYNQFRKILEIKIQQQSIEEERANNYKQILEREIDNIEAEYLFANKFVIKDENPQSLSDKDAKIFKKSKIKKITKNQNFSQKIRENSIEKLITETTKNSIKAKNRKKYLKFLKIFGILIFIFFLFFTIFWAFFAKKSFFLKGKNHPFTLDSSQNNTQNLEKSSYRLLPDGTEIQVALSQEESKMDKSKLKKDNHEFFQKELAFHISHFSSQKVPSNWISKELDEQLYKKNKVEWNFLEEGENLENGTKINGRVYINDLKGFLNLQFYKNTNPNINSAYFLEINFSFLQNENTSTFKELLDFTTYENVKSSGTQLQNVESTYIGDNYFIYNFENEKPFLSNNLRLLRNSLGFSIKARDSHDIIHEFFFTKGKKGDIIFYDAFSNWIDDDY